VLSDIAENLGRWVSASNAIRVEKKRRRMIPSTIKVGSPGVS
jgi:hypothetical protein